MATLVAASMVKLYCDVAHQYGISRQELLTAAGLDAEALSDPNALVPRAASEQLLRVLVQRCNDPALGFVIARSFDLRTMGFWGYALLSALTLRQRIQLHLRYSRVHFPTRQFSYRIEGGRAICDIWVSDLPPDLVPVIMDSGLFISCKQLGKHLQCARPEVELWLTYAEEPHHRELRELVTGTIVFGAPHFRIAFAEKELDRRLLGDPYLLELAKEQLETQLAKVLLMLQGDLLSEVRARLVARLSGDASLETVAADLRISARTLRRRLSALGASFQAVLEDERRAQAMRYLLETNQAIEHVAKYLGYRDPANFRRAFRRWTGAAPADFRRQHRPDGMAQRPPRAAAAEG